MMKTERNLLNVENPLMTNENLCSDLPSLRKIKFSLKGEANLELVRLMIKSKIILSWMVHHTFPTILRPFSAKLCMQIRTRVSWRHQAQRNCAFLAALSFSRLLISATLFIVFWWKMMTRFRLKSQNVWLIYSCYEHQTMERNWEFEAAVGIFVF